MATTSYTDFTAGCRAIGARTDAAGTAATDLASDEDRLINHILTEGYLTAGAFEVAADSPASMDVIVGSGTAKADLYVVEGDDTGQHPYIVRLDDATKTVTLDAADASNPRIDEIWLVVADATFDSGSVSLPRIGYRKGTAAASPAAPGADSSWKASVKLATITVSAGASSVGSGDITDNRAAASLTAELLSKVFDASSLADLGTANGADLDDLGTFASNIEVDGHTEVSGSTSLSGSHSTVASVNLSIPAAWGSWKCFVSASWATSGASSDQYNAKVTIDGTDEVELTSIESGNAVWTPGSAVARRTGMSTTGSRTIALKMREIVGTGTSVRQVTLYARAVRTS